MDTQAHHERLMVDWAMSLFRVKQITVEWDKTAKVWDIETRSGWRTCRTPQELARLAKDVQRGNA